MTIERFNELEASGVIKAWKEGRTWQHKPKHSCLGTRWLDNYGDISPFDECLSSYDLRVKPEPRSWWINIYPGISSIHAHRSKSEADHDAGPERTECIQVWEKL